MDGRAFLKTPRPLNYLEPISKTTDQKNTASRKIFTGKTFS
jgi:hypothetical protein